MSYVNALALAADCGITVDESRSNEPSPFAGPAALDVESDRARRRWPARCSPPTARAWSRSTACRSSPIRPGTCCSSATATCPGVVGKIGTILGRAARQHRGLPARARQRRRDGGLDHQRGRPGSRCRTRGASGPSRDRPGPFADRVARIRDCRACRQFCRISIVLLPVGPCVAGVYRSRVSRFHEIQPGGETHHAPHGEHDTNAGAGLRRRGLARGDPRPRRRVGQRTGRSTRPPAATGVRPATAPASS